MRSTYTLARTAAALLLGASLLLPAHAQVRVSVSGTHGYSEGTCLQAGRALGGFDCTYAGTSLLDTPGGWAGPALGGTYYTAGSAGDSVLYSPIPGDGKAGAPVSGFLAVEGFGEEASISGTLIIGAGVRNIATGPADRAVQRWTTITHTLASTPVNSAAANSNGGFNYVIGTLGAPEELCLAPGGVCFGTHETGADPAAGPAGTWGVGGIAGLRPEIGITALENLAGSSATGDLDLRNIGATTTAVIDGDSCASTSPDDCNTGATLWGRGEDPGFDNLILVVATNSAGDITSGRAYWSQDFRQAAAGAPAGDNSTVMGTFTFSGNVAPPTCDDFFFGGALEDSSNTVISTEIHCANFNEFLTVYILDGPDHGTATVNGQNDIVYTPNPGFTGTDTISYRGTDGLAADDGVLIITVDPNLTPSAPDGTISISTQGVAPEATDGALNLGLLSGYSGGNPPTTVALAQLPANGTASLTGTTVRYTPNAGFYTGTDTFTYTVTDLYGDSDEGTVTVTIGNATPTLADAVLATDRDTASAPLDLVIVAGNGAPAQHTLVVTTDGTHGACTLTAANAGGRLVYTPEAGFIGTDSCVIRITDATGDQDTGTISITVNDDAAVPTPPTITGGTPPAGTVGQAYSFAYTASGTAPIGFSLGTGALPPGLTLSAAGVISGSPTTAGTYAGTVIASNGALPNATQAFSIVVANGNSGGGGGGGGGGGALDLASVLALLLVGLARRRVVS